GYGSASHLSVSTSPTSKLSIQDPGAFPSLSSDSGSNWSQGTVPTTPSTPRHNFRQLQGSRPNSRQASREPPPVNDDEAFPSLGSAKPGKKKDNRRKQDNIPTGPSSLADVVRMTPSPSPGAKRWGPPSHSHHNSPSKARRNQPAQSQAAAATAAGQNANASSNQAHISNPTSLPWLDPQHPLNKPYLTHRTLSLKHGNQRNKYLSAAAAAWARHDAKAAKSLSLRASAENE